MPLQAPKKNYRLGGAGSIGYRGFGIIKSVRDEINDLGLLGVRLFGKSGPNRLRNNRTIVPVGGGVVSVQQPSYVVPQVVAETPTTPTTTLFPEIDRRDTPQIQGELQVTTWNVSGRETLQDLRDLVSMGMVLIANDWFAYHKANEAGIPITAPGTIAEPVAAPAPVQTTESSSMDLGAILGGVQTAVDIYGQYKAITQPQTVAYQPSLQTLPQVGSSIIDFFTDPATGAVVPVRKKKPCRRRRKRLATKSDLGDLAALKAILGNGEAFKAWIATHSR